MLPEVGLQRVSKHRSTLLVAQAVEPSLILEPYFEKYPLERLPLKNAIKAQLLKLNQQ
jgi:hypothetical protein